MSFMGYSALFRVSVRPARAAYLIAEGSRDGFRRAVQEATSRWGGQTEPIVPVREDGTIDPGYRNGIEVAHVDGLVNVDAPEGHARSLAGSFDMQLTPIEHIDRSGMTKYTSHPVDLGLPADVGGHNGYVIAAEGAPLWQVAAAGDLLPEAEKGFHEGGMQTRRARFDHEIGESQVWGHTLLGATTASMAEEWANPAPTDAPAAIFLVSEDDSLEDCLDFWNRRALRPVGNFGTFPMYMLPADVSHWTTWPAVLVGSLQRPDQFSPDVLITSCSVDEDVMHAFAQSMGLQLSEDDFVRRSLTLGKMVPKRSAPFTYVTGFPKNVVMFGRRYGVAETVDVPVVGEKSALRFASPVPTTDPNIGGLSLVSISGGPIDALPKREPVARLVSDDAVWHDGAIQIPDRIQRSWRIELRIPTLAAAYEAVMCEVTSSHHLSDKGALGVGLMKQAALDVVGEPNVFESIKQLTTPRGEKIAKELQNLFGKDGQELSDAQKKFAEGFGGRSERIFKCAENLGYGSFEVAQTTLERLAGIGWAERGFRTECDGCKIKSFVPFSAETARGVARCPVCGASTGYTRETDRGLVVYHRLDGRVDFANDSGVIAHLMVIAALTRRREYTFLTPGADLLFNDGAKGEADILGIYDGKLVSGEVKMSGHAFTDRQVNKDLDIVQRLRSEIYVMAATDTIKDDVKERTQARCDALGVQLLLLEHDDLLLH